MQKIETSIRCASLTVVIMSVLFTLVLEGHTEVIILTRQACYQLGSPRPWVLWWSMSLSVSEDQIAWIAACLWSQSTGKLPSSYLNAGMLILSSSRPRIPKEVCCSILGNKNSRQRGPGQNKWGNKIKNVNYHVNFRSMALWAVSGSQISLLCF